MDKKTLKLDKSVSSHTHIELKIPFTYLPCVCRWVDFFFLFAWWWGWRVAWCEWMKMQGKCIKYNIQKKFFFISSNKSELYQRLLAQWLEWCFHTMMLTDENGRRNCCRNVRKMISNQMYLKQINALRLVKTFLS